MNNSARSVAMNFHFCASANCQDGQDGKPRRITLAASTVAVHFGRRKGEARDA